MREKEEENVLTNHHRASHKYRYQIYIFLTNHHRASHKSRYQIYIFLNVLFAFLQWGMIDILRPWAGIFGILDDVLGIRQDKTRYISGKLFIHQKIQ